MFYCPSRRPVGLYPGGVGQNVQFLPGLSGNVAKTDYAGNGGSVGFNFFARTGCPWWPQTGGPHPSCNAGNSPNDTSTPTPSPMPSPMSVSAYAGTLPPLSNYWFIPPCRHYANGSVVCPPSGTYSDPPAIPGTTFTGVTWYRSEVSLRQLSDGASKVYLIGEKYLDSLNYNTADDDNDDGTLYQGMAQTNIRMGASGGVWSQIVGQPTGQVQYQYSQVLYTPYQDMPIWGLLLHQNNPQAVPAGVGQFDAFNGMRFGSAHASSFNMAFCDGSVHALDYEIDATIHACLSDRQDGLTVDSNQYID
jgi:prepilin-type processing-associated H-X9-DG protein